MSIELVEAIASLSSVLDEEDALLATPGCDPALAPLVEAKVRLVGVIEAESVRLGGSDWIVALNEAQQTDLVALIGGLRDKLGANADLLRRRIALCDDVMGAVAAEAKRLTGGRSVTYGARGALATSEQTAPIAVNARL